MKDIIYDAICNFIEDNYGEKPEDACYNIEEMSIEIERALDEEVERIFVINGKTKSTGVWEVECYGRYEEARRAFENYMIEYEAEESWQNFAECSEGSFWIEEVEVVK